MFDKTKKKFECLISYDYPNNILSIHKAIDILLFQIVYFTKNIIKIKTQLNIVGCFKV